MNRRTTKASQRKNAQSFDVVPGTFFTVRFHAANSGCHPPHIDAMRDSPALAHEVHSGARGDLF